MKELFKKRVMITIALCLALIGGVWWWLGRDNQPEVTYQFATVQRGTVAVSVSAGGNLRAEQQAHVSAFVPGTVASISVKTGDTVSEGQVLFTVDSPSLDADIAEAYATYLEAKQGVEQARSGVAEAQAERTLIHSNPASIDEQKNAANQRVTAALAGVQAAEQQQAATWQRYDNQRSQAAQRTVRAPVAGIVTNLNVSVGNQVGGGNSRTAPTATNNTSRDSTSAASTASDADVVIQSSHTLKAFVAINETDVPKVKPGQKVRLTFDAFDTLSATGTVEQVASVGTSEQGLVTYQAVIALDAIDPQFRAEMSVSADITTETKDNVLFVPITAVKSRAGGEKYVEVWQAGAPKAVTVQSGLVSSAVVEITSGLSEGQQVITQTINARDTETGPASKNQSSSPLPGSPTGPKGQ